MKIQTLALEKAIRDQAHQLNIILEKLDLDAKAQYDAITYIQQDFEELKFQLTQFEDSLKMMCDGDSEEDETPTVETVADRAIRQRDAEFNL